MFLKLAYCTISFLGIKYTETAKNKLFTKHFYTISYLQPASRIN